MQVCCHHVIYMYIITLHSQKRIYASISIVSETRMLFHYDIIILYYDEKLFLLVCLLKVPVNIVSIALRQLPVF